MNRWLFRLLWLGGVVGVVAILKLLFGLPVFVGAPLIALALIINGRVADWEDERPGGFLNPKSGQSE